MYVPGIMYLNIVDRMLHDVAGILPCVGWWEIVFHEVTAVRIIGAKESVVLGKKTVLNISIPRIENFVAMLRSH